MAPQRRRSAVSLALYAIAYLPFLPSIGLVTTWQFSAAHCTAWSETEKFSLTEMAQPTGGGRLSAASTTNSSIRIQVPKRRPHSRGPYQLSIAE